MPLQTQLHQGLGRKEDLSSLCDLRLSAPTPWLVPFSLSGMLTLIFNRQKKKVKESLHLTEDTSHGGVCQSAQDAPKKTGHILE